MNSDALNCAITNMDIKAWSRSPNGFPSNDGVHCIPNLHSFGPVDEVQSHYLVVNSATSGHTQVSSDASEASAASLFQCTPEPLARKMPYSENHPRLPGNAPCLLRGDMGSKKTPLRVRPSLGHLTAHTHSVLQKHLTSLGSTFYRGNTSSLSCDFAPARRHVRQIVRSDPIQPTILTVEAAINAKVFLETYYERLLTNCLDSRATISALFDSYIRREMPSKRRMETENAVKWDLSSAHLRQLRVLKCQFNAQKDTSGLNLGDLEILRTLGKGSFGVVKLVRRIATTISEGALSPLVDHTRPVFTREEGLAIMLRKSYTKPPGVFAMKVIRKSNMLRNCQEGHVRAERDFLASAEDSHWIIPLIASFEDRHNLYLVLEYMIGGDVLGLLFRRNILKERHARWYVAEMILCVEEIHRRMWIHRDIKPDNFLISASGHLKISDFGLAFDGHWSHDQRYYSESRASLMEKLSIKVRGDEEDQRHEEEHAEISKSSVSKDCHSLYKACATSTSLDGRRFLSLRDEIYDRRRRAASIVGTSQYMAPEIIRGGFYDARCDWWSIGIILYECIYGFTPFVCEKRSDTKSKILDHCNTLNFPPDGKAPVSNAAKNLISLLLREREGRLSARRYQQNDRKRLWDHDASPANYAFHKTSTNFVYPDDATDIKAHPFFASIVWDRLHLTRPPFVPSVHGSADTKYFDDENSFSDTVEVDITLAHQPSLTRHDLYAKGAVQVDGAVGATHLMSIQKEIQIDDHQDRQWGQAAFECKRPRDKVLRDQEVALHVLECRKKGIFAGYTYHRPNMSRYQ